jgi:hypothetical protein
MLKKKKDKTLTARFCTGPHCVSEPSNGPSFSTSRHELSSILTSPSDIHITTITTQGARTGRVARKTRISPSSEHMLQINRELAKYNMTEMDSLAVLNLNLSSVPQPFDSRRWETHPGGRSMRRSVSALVNPMLFDDDTTVNRPERPQQGHLSPGR